MAREHSIRERLRFIIFESETPAAKGFDVALIIAVLASVAVVVVSTLDEAQVDPLKSICYGLEWFFTLLFTVEYVTRLAVAKHPLRYALSFYGIVDLLSILPAFIGLIVPGGERLLVVRTLRVLRVFRVLKLTRYLSESRALREAVWISRHKIAVFLVAVLIIVLIASTLMHLIEGGTPIGDEPSPFRSIPGAMYWTIITMTTVGYGDIIPQSNIGKFIATILVLIGYSLIIVPTGILSAEITSSREPARARTKCSTCGEDRHDFDAKFCKECGERLVT